MEREEHDQHHIQLPSRLSEEEQIRWQPIPTTPVLPETSSTASSPQPPLRLRHFMEQQASAPPTPRKFAFPTLPATPRPEERQKGKDEKSGSKRTLPLGRLILHQKANFFVYTYNRQSEAAYPLHKAGIANIQPRVTHQQQRRIVESETRRMPRLEPINPLRRSRFSTPTWIEVLLVLLVIGALGIAHAYNMFNYPRYELDEGTYMLSAWSILQGQIMPYSYGYGHPPAGWIQLATWLPWLNGFFTFGNAINTGRVILLLYKLGSIPLVYLITRRLMVNRNMGLLAMVLFALTPLGLTYQREVYLDNIAVFWFLLSLFLLVNGNSRLLAIIGSALALGISILTKEVMILLFPAMLYAVWLHTTHFQRKFALVAFIYTTSALCSAWILMALMRGEFFPYSWHLPGDSHNHLSMLQTILEQSGRTQSEGSLSVSWGWWIRLDGVMLLLSIGATIFNLCMGFRQRKQLLLALLSLSFWLLLIRGGVVFPYYIIPLLPLTAINGAFMCDSITRWLSRATRRPFLQGILVLFLIAALVPYDIIQGQNVYTLDYTQTQRQTMDWIRTHLPRNAFVVIPPQYFVDMRLSGGEATGDIQSFPNAHLFFNVATDPAVYHDMLKDDWNNIDYIIVDPDVRSRLDTLNDPRNGNSLLKQAFMHSVERIRFYDISIYEVKHTRKVEKRASIMHKNLNLSIFRHYTSKSTVYIDKYAIIG